MASDGPCVGPHDYDWCKPTARESRMGATKVMYCKDCPVRVVLYNFPEPREKEEEKMRARRED